MDLGSIMLILALALGVGIYISLPLTRHPVSEELVSKQKSTDGVDHKRSSLLAERDRVLRTVQELDFDNALGKIPAEDYPVQRNALMATGAEVLRQLDQIESEGGAAGSVEDRLEAAIAARRADMRRAPSNGTDDLEMAIALRRRERQEKSAGFCPKCGKPVQSSDVFCAHCGNSL
jgi:hypothetical protein